MNENEARKAKKTETGVVVSTKMAKTVVVKVEHKRLHEKYGKVIQRNKKYYAHCDENYTANLGDKVTIVECRPFSKLKRWRVVEVVKGASA